MVGNVDHKILDPQAGLQFGGPDLFNSKSVGYE
jgi:hypothetical protein